jgi:beta-glucanase (GH16 family)
MGDGAWSAHWILKKNSNGTYWIENRWKTGQRLNIEKGKLECSIVGDGAWSAMWKLSGAMD